MSERMPVSETFWPLLDAACDDTLTETQVHELAAALASDKNACDVLLDHIQLQIDIRFLCQSAKACELGIAEIDTARRVSNSSPIPILPSLSSTIIHGTAGYYSSGWPVAYLVATVVLGLGLLIGSFVYVSQPPQIARPSVPPAPLSPLPSIVGRITRMVDCQCVQSPEVGWVEPREPHQKAASGSPNPNPQSPVHLHDRFALSSGLMEITYDTGAKVILQGPCTYEVESVAGGYLSLGKLTARVEEKEDTNSPRPSDGGHRREALVGAGGEGGEKNGDRNESQRALTLTLSQRERGPDARSSFLIPHSYFAVRTPTATVTDLGTEFGVEVSPGGVTETEVFVGEVEVVSVDGEAGVGEEPQVVRAGQTARVEGRRILLAVTGRQDANKKRFVRAMSASAQSYTADTYAELVLSMQPVAYYRMEQPRDKKDCNVVFDSAPGGHHGVLHLANEYGGDPWRHGQFGNALTLRGGDTPDYADVQDFPAAQTDQLSAAAWVYCLNSPVWAKIAHEGQVDSQFAFGLFQYAGDLMAGVLQRDGTEVQVREGESKPLPRFVWQHVAFVADGKMLHLYRNGREVDAAPCDGVRRVPIIKQFGIGHQKTRPLPSEPPDATIPECFWQGYIDELAVFCHALSAEQVKQLYTRQSASERPAGGNKH